MSTNLGPQFGGLIRHESEIHPGEMPFHDWLQRPDVQYHAGLSDQGPRGTYIHLGSRAAATRRGESMVMGSSMRGYRLRPDFGAGPNPRAREPAWYAEGALQPSDLDIQPAARLYARRIQTGFADRPRSDAGANLTHVRAALLAGDTVSRSLLGSLPKTPPGLGASVGEYEEYLTKRTPDVRRLQVGKSIPYRNSHEDQGSISHVVGQHGLSSWEQDVLGASREGRRSPAPDAMRRIIRGPRALSRVQFTPPGRYSTHTPSGWKSVPGPANVFVMKDPSDLVPKTVPAPASSLPTLPWEKKK